MDSSNSQRRLRALQAQFEQSPAGVAHGGVERRDTVAKLQREYNYDLQSVALPEKLTPKGPWLVHRCAETTEALVDSFPPPNDHVRTLYDAFENSVAKHGESPYLGKRQTQSGDRAGPYQWLTYAQVAAIRSAIGSGLLQLGVEPGARVGLYGVNSVEWALVDAAAQAYSLVSVPLYDTLGPETVEYICNHGELSAVACASAVLDKVVEALPSCPTVRLVVVYDAAPNARLPEAKAGSQAKITSLERVRAVGARSPRAHVPPTPEDLAIISYTSGTTGTPKGAMVTHGNLVAAMAASLVIGSELFADPASRQNPVYISYLPLAHIYERFFFSLMTYLGAAVGFYRGDVLLLLEDVEALRPTVFCSVPRLWNRIYDRVQAQVAQASAPARALFHAAYASKKAALEAGDADGGRWAPLWNRLVFGKIKAKLGGRVRLMVSGSAPIAPEVLMFLKICFDAHVIEGYGLTETSASAIVSAPGDPMLGHVGPPLPGVEVKLADVPEMGYTNADSPHPRGEVCLRGPIVFKGYYKDPANTAEALDSEGWLHSGDIGAWLPGGRLKIIDRKKNIFKLSQGEYIAPEKIEAVYGRSPFVAQSFVYGDSLKSALVAVVVPDAEHLLPWAATRSWGADLAQLCADPRVRASVLHSMQEEGRAAGLKGFEQVVAVHLLPELFSAENGLLTPTFKLKRPQVQARFQTHIDDMYAAIPK